ncbi:hypothetical protein ACWNT8_06605 [Pigmentibacter ruber]
MKLTICNLSIFSLMVPFFISCGNAVDNKRKLPKANETVNLPKQEVPNQQINEFEKKITELMLEKDELNKKIVELNENFKNSNTLKTKYHDKIKEFINKTKLMLKNNFELENDSSFNDLIALLDDLIQSIESKSYNNYNLSEEDKNNNFDNLFVKLTSYFQYYFNVTYKNKINAQVTPKIYDLLESTNLLADSNKVTKSKENITDKIINNNISEVIEEINENIKKINTNIEKKNEAEKLAEKNKFIKILKEIRIDGKKLFSEKTDDQLRNDISETNFITILNDKIKEIILEIKDNCRTDILNKIGVPSNEYNTFKLTDFEKNLKSKFENDFKKIMINYLIKNDIISDDKNKNIYKNDDFKYLQDTIYQFSSNYSSIELYELIVSELLKLRKIKTDKITKLNEELTNKEKQIESISLQKSIYASLEPFPGLNTNDINCLNNVNNKSEYINYIEASNEPYLVEISSIYENIKSRDFLRSKNRINQCVNNKQLQNVDNKIINIEFFKHKDSTYNEVFIIHIEDNMKSKYSFHFPEQSIYKNRYYISNYISSDNLRTYTKLDQYSQDILENDGSNEMHAILFSRYFSDQITHGHSSVYTKFSLLNADSKYEFWLVDNNNSENNNQLHNAKKFMKIEISKYQKLFGNSTSINTCFYSRIDSKLVKKCFDEDFGEHLPLKEKITGRF